MDARELLARAQVAAGLTQKQLGDLLGVSERTVSRLHAGQSFIWQDYWAKLAPAVFARDAQLGALCARMSGKSLEGLGLVQSKAAPEPPKPAPTATHLVDSVLCAAAVAMEVSPQAIRPAVEAAFRRAADMGTSVDTVLAVLGAPPRPGKRSQGA